MTPFQYYLFIGCAAFFGVGLIVALLLSWRRTSPETLKELRTFLRMSLAYLICNSLEITSSHEAGTVFFASLAYAFIGGILVAVFLFSLRFSGHDVLATRLRFLRWVIPAAQLLAVFTNGFHHLHWVSLTFVRVGPFISMQAAGYGIVFWVMYAYLQFFAISSIVLLCISVVTRSRAVNRQTVTVLVGTLIPLLFNSVYVLRLIPGLRKDFTPIAYAMTALLFVIASYYDRLFDLIPIARSALVEKLADPLIAVDGDGRIIDSNPAARAVCGLPQDANGTMILDNHFLASVARSLSRSDFPAVEAKTDQDHWFEVRTTDVRAGDRMLCLYSMRDITERRRLMEEKSELIERLSRALSDIHTLEGIVPICASCKKVRDDSGFWEQVENYVASHTMVEFSHGICPDCTARLYPDLGVDAKDDGDGADPEAAL